MWHKDRWCCRVCGGSWTEDEPCIAPPRSSLTDRAGRWVTEQVGRHGRSVAEVAADLACHWHTVDDAVMAYGTALVDDDPDPDSWRDQIAWATLDLSATYKTVFDTMLPDATQVADPFHVVRNANGAVDECRRRVQNETLGHRGRKHDPLFRCRRLLQMADERINDDGRERLRGLLAAVDPRGEVRLCWHAKEVVRQTYDHTDTALAEAWIDDIERDFADPDMPPEVRRLGRTIGRWRDEIVAWHHAHVTNDTLEALNNLVKHVKRVAFGLKRFAHYRIRALLYAGRPNWDLLATITPR